MHQGLEVPSQSQNRKLKTMQLSKRNDQEKISVYPTYLRLTMQSIHRTHLIMRKQFLIFHLITSSPIDQDMHRIAWNRPLHISSILNLPSSTHAKQKSKPNEIHIHLAGRIT